MRKFFYRPALFFLAVLIGACLYGCGKNPVNIEAESEAIFESVEDQDVQSVEITESDINGSDAEETSAEEASTVEASAVAASAEEASAEDEELLQLLQELSTREKLTMMMIPALRKWGTEGTKILSAEQIKLLQDNHFGGIILFADNIGTNVQTYRLIKSMQKANCDGGAKAQLFITCDQEGGLVTRLLYGTELVGNMALCASGDTALTKEAAGIIGEELSVLGFNLDLAPVLDVNNNPENPIIGVRSFSDDPVLVSENGKKYIQGLHEKSVMTCVKHFPGHGDTKVDSHSGFPCIDKDYDSLKSLELIPFKECISAGTEFIMTAHIQYPQIESGTYKSISGEQEVYIPASLSKTFLTDIVRNDLGFKGLIITDDLTMDAIDENFEQMDVAKMAINSGADLLLSPFLIDSNDSIDKFTSYLDKLVEMTEAGDIEIEKVDEAVIRILKLKRDKGLLFGDEAPSFEVEKEDEERVNGIVGSLSHHEKEWEIALKCVTLVKNQGVLPIAKGSNVLIACPHKYLVSSAVYADKLLRKDGIIGDETKITIINFSEMEESGLRGMAGNYDVVVALSYESGSEEKIQKGVVTLCKGAADAGKKSVVISCKLPYDLSGYSADALMACYNGRGMLAEPTDFAKDTRQYEPNTMAAIYIAFGGNNPTGKLPVRVPVIGEDGTFSSEIMYERGFGIDY
jgi:beta-N-acetylhexosaminidase